MTQSPVSSQELSCSLCGYSLHTLDSAGVCPECGRAVADSMEAIRHREATFGPPLRAHSPAWLRTAASGFFVFLLGGVVILVVDLLRLPGRWWLLVVSDAISAIGVWLMTIRPLAAKKRGELLRWMTRLALTAWLIADAIGYIGMAVSQRPPANDVPMWASLWSSAVGTLSGYLYLAHLAGRMRKLLVRRVFLVLAIIPILMILAITKTMRGVYDPTLFGLSLPWPVFPFVGQAEELLYIRFALNSVLAGRVSWQHALSRALPIWISSVASISGLLWYGLILLGIASRRAEREAMERNA